MKLAVGMGHNEYPITPSPNKWARAFDAPFLTYMTGLFACGVAYTTEDFKATSVAAAAYVISRFLVDSRQPGSLEAKVSEEPPHPLQTD